MRVSTKDRIIHYVRYNGQVSGSELEDQAHEWGTKASVISRRCRDLVREGKLERLLSDKRTVQYNVIRPVDIPTQLFEIPKKVTI